MVSGVCQRIGSCLLPQGAIKKVALAGVTGLSYCAAGFPGVIAALGTYLYLRQYSAQKVQRPLSFSVGAQMDDHKRPFQSARRIDDSARLFEPQGKPAIINWSDNSCFCSSAMWAAFGNMPEIIGEIPEAIGRRLDEAELFPYICGIDGCFDPNKSEQAAALIEIAPILRSKLPIRLADLKILCKNLQKLEKTKFFESHINGAAKLKELLSLLELHGLVREFQTSPSISGDRINTMRQMVYRVNPNFNKRPGVIGDAHEVFQTLGDLIFEGSHFQQPLTNTRTGKELNLSKTASTWGDFVLPMPPKGVGNCSMQSIFETYLSPMIYPLEYGTGKNRKTYQVSEVNQFTTPPQMLVLTLNRARSIREDEEWDEAATHNMGAVKVDERLVLPAKFSKNGREGLYRLTGLSRHLGDFAHYDAIVERGGHWFYCDDLKKARYPFNPGELSKTAESGYMFFYRRTN